MKILLIFTVFLITLTSAAFAEEFPVAELGNCASEIECQAYCDNPDNLEACITYGEKSGRLSGPELEEAKKVLPFLKAGTTPGNCKTEKECDDYCSKQENFNECVDFAVKIGELTPEKAELAKKTGGVGPGGCKEDECEAYCKDETHLSECIDFAEQNGMMNKSDADRIRKIQSGGGPGKCKTADECDNYCKGTAHQEECINFAVEMGEIEPEEARIMIACKDDMQTCDNYCYTDEHFDDCIEVWKKGGLSTEQEKVEKLYWYEHPGGCRRDRACAEDFCSRYENFEKCWKFEVDTGFMSEAEYQQNIDELKAIREKSEREAQEEQDRMQKEFDAAQKTENSESESQQQVEQIEPAPQQEITGQAIRNNAGILEKILLFILTLH